MPEEIVKAFSEKLQRSGFSDSKEILCSEHSVIIQKNYQLSTGDILRKKVVLYLEQSDKDNNRFNYIYAYSYCCPYVLSDYPVFLSSRIEDADNVNDYQQLLDWLYQDFSNEDIKRITGVTLMEDKQ